MWLYYIVICQKYTEEMANSLEPDQIASSELFAQALISIADKGVNWGWGVGGWEKRKRRGKKGKEKEGGRQGEGVGRKKGAEGRKGG